MSVFTPVPPAELESWLTGFDVGTLRALHGIAEGVQNSNFFVSTSAGEYVLTLFEHIETAALDYYLALMAHLAARGIPCPAPIPARSGALLGQLCGKPAALFSRLPGRTVAEPDAAQCAAAGDALARLHLAGADFARRLPHPRDAAWRQALAPTLLPLLPADDAALLERELTHQAAQRAGTPPLPGGAIHADLFRDNVLFADGARIGGLLDFYFAGDGDWLFDLAVTANDWCLAADATLDPARTASLLDAYHARRPLTAAEQAAWPLQLRAAALRFWMSRLEDFHRPRPGETVTVRDPAAFRRILEARIAAGGELPWRRG